MANHIENYIRIENANEEILTELKRIFEIKEGDYEVHTEDLGRRVFGNEAPEEYDREWYINKCGAKWLNGFIEYDDSDEIVINITSAWDPINPFLERLSENLQKIKSDVVLSNQFEDEGYNFAGVYYTSKEYDDVEWVDMDEYDVEELWEDDEVRGRYHQELIDIYESHITCHKELIEDMKNNPSNYE